MKKIEIACFTIQSALVAAQSNADRIEFCADAHLGGTTPSLPEILTLISKSKQELRIMIRPRGGDFCYTEEEFQMMKNSILKFKNLKIEGFVFGILTADHKIDLERNKELIELASPLKCAFHRAFDRTSNLKESLEQVIDLGFHTILTSGLSANVNEGIENLKYLVELANGRIEIMPGGGLRSSNIQTIASSTQANYFHSSALTDASGIANLEEINLLKSLIN